MGQKMVPNLTESEEKNLLISSAFFTVRSAVCRANPQGLLGLALHKEIFPHNLFLQGCSANFLGLLYINRFVTKSLHVEQLKTLAILGLALHKEIFPIISFCRAALQIFRPALHKENCHKISSCRARMQACSAYLQGCSANLGLLYLKSSPKKTL